MELYIDELVVHLSKLCRQLVVKLASGDLRSKQRYDERVGEFYEFK